MPSDEAAFSVTKQFHTIRGTTLEEFKSNVESLLGEGSFGHVSASFQEAFQVEDRAVNNLRSAGLVSTTPVQVPPSATIGGSTVPMPQPSSVAPQPADQPPLSSGGNCQHGARVYRDTNTKNGPWRRWECAIPWSKDGAANRCKAVNV